MLVVVGMGQKLKDITLLGKETIEKAKYVIVKSQKTHAAREVEAIRMDAIYCDDLYETCEDFDILNQAIAARLVQYSSKGLTAFCVVGDGSDDSTVMHLATHGVDFGTVAGIGLQSAVTTKGILEGTRIYSAYSFVQENSVLAVPTIIKSLDDKLIAGQVRLLLLQAFDCDTPILYSDGAKQIQTTLDMLDKQKFSYRSAMYIMPKQTVNKQVFGFFDAVEVLHTLRSDNGCPWDKVQTHKTLQKNVIEEAYELVNAISQDDVANMIEELGDLLMQVLFHIEIAQGDGEFAAEDVYTALCRKLIDRHPHVFGALHAADSAEALSNWEKAKQKEHKLKNLTENMLDVPHSLSALMRAYKLQYRAAKGGYDFSDISQSVDKVKEELAEFLSAVDEDQKLAEGGDLLFAVVNLLRLTNTEPETALLQAADKFLNRVVYIEKVLAQKGVTLTDLPAQRFDDLWKEAKENVG